MNSSQEHPFTCYCVLAIFIVTVIPVTIGYIIYTVFLLLHMKNRYNTDINLHLPNSKFQKMPFKTRSLMSIYLPIPCLVSASLPLPLVSSDDSSLAIGSISSYPGFLLCCSLRILLIKSHGQCAGQCFPQGWSCSEEPPLHFARFASSLLGQLFLST